MFKPLQAWTSCNLLHGLGPPVCTLLTPGVHHRKTYCPVVVDPVLLLRYRRILGYVAWLVQMTRPDLVFAYAELSKFLSAPGERHLDEAHHMLCYVAGTTDRGITYSDPGVHQRNRLMAWVDSDFAADPDMLHLVTGYICSLNNGPILWKAKHQSCTTLSSAEAEFVASSICCQEIIYL